MRQLKIGDRIITQKDVFVIAEIGSNHMGDADLCEKMIIEAAACGVDAVKMQKRDNREMFTKTAYSRPYESESSYGKTYGEHREHLDWFDMKEFRRFKAIAEKHGVMFFATPFEEKSAMFLMKLGVPMFKIASCDATNTPFIRFLAKTGKPLLISTGGCSRQDLIDLRAAIEPITDNYAVLHCISTYPNADNQLNLRAISSMRSIFHDKLIGFSSHHPGLLPLYAARFMGASIFEVHFTLNRGFRGTDHGFSLEPQGLKKLCADLRRLEAMMGSEEKQVLEAEKGGFINKMGKGIYLKTGKKAGEIIEKADIIVKSPYDGGYRPGNIGEVEGRIAMFDLATGVNISLDHLGE